jgi:hypothetical protein
MLIGLSNPTTKHTPSRTVPLEAWAEKLELDHVADSNRLSTTPVSFRHFVRTQGGYAKLLVGGKEGNSVTFCCRTRPKSRGWRELQDPYVTECFPTSPLLPTLGIS